MDDKPNNWGALIFGGVVSIIIAIINNSGHSQKDQHDIKKASDGTPYELTLDGYKRQKQRINRPENQIPIPYLT